MTDHAEPPTTSGPDDAATSGKTDSAALTAALFANRAYADLLTSSTAVTTSEYAAALESRGIDCEAARAHIKRSHSHNELLTITHQGEALIPTFQLDRDFEHSALAASVITALLDAGWSAWEIWDWAEAPNAWIVGSPSDAIREHDSDALNRALAAATGDGPDA